MRSIDSNFVHPACLLVLVSSLTVGCGRKPEWREVEGSSAASANVAASAAPATEPPAPDPVRPLYRRTYATLVSGDLVHTGTSAGVASWDYSDPKEPKQLADLVLAGNVQHLSALPSPSTLVVAATGPTGFAVVDTGALRDKGLVLVNEHPWKPAQRNGCHSAWSFASGSEDTGYLACGAAGVARVELGDPANAAVDALVEVDGYVRDVVLLDEGAGVPKPAASSKKVAAAAGFRGLVTVDFGGVAPRLAGQVDLGGEARALTVHDGHAYVAAGAAGLVVVDVRKPADPVVVGRLLPKTTDMARGVAFVGHHALLCLGDSGLAVVDVADPAAPKEVGRFDPARALNRVTVQGERLFVANDADGVAILDISNPEEIQQVAPPPKPKAGGT